MRRVLASLLFLSLPLSATAATFVQVTIDGRLVTFTDVPDDAWFAVYVRGAAQAGIVSGYKNEQGEPTGRFEPGNSVTIAEALKMATEGAGYELPPPPWEMGCEGSCHWADGYLTVAFAHGFHVIETTHELDRPATRAEVAAMFAGAFKVDTETPIGNRYDDVRFQTEHGFAIEALSRDGVLSGDTDVSGRSTGTFRPLDEINRAEVAKMAIVARATYGTPGAE